MKEIRLLEEAVTEEKQKLEQLGPRPLLQTFPAGGSEWLFLIVWPPLVLVWFGMPYVFGIKLSTSMKVGTTLVIFMIFGFFSDRIDKRYRERFDKAIEPFRPGDNKIAELEAEIKQKKGISSSPSRIIW